MKFTDILHENNPTHIEPPWFKVALIEPEIPQNTGNIGRTCVGTRAELQIVGKLGYTITNSALKRAGLDYWQHLKWKHYPDFDEWYSGFEKPDRIFYLSTKATKTIFETEFQIGDCFVFGRETKGLDEELLRRNAARAIKIPQYGPVRSLNVATAVSIVMYEAIRQTQFSSRKS